ncbi:MAG TPA: TonB-dependent receptor [Terriglobales bacterium]|nr:TonB-dependent receptor [Terriglobales bacterium]
MRPPAPTKSFLASTDVLRSGKITGGAIVVVIAALVLSLPLHAQLYSGSLTGHVTDPSGATVPNAKIILTDVGKQYQYKATTDAQGLYLLRPLPPATYQLTVKAPGFAEYTRSSVTLDVNQNATADVRLAVAAAKEEMVVTAAAPLLAAQDATTGQEVNQVFVNNLPLINREIMDLTFLAPGVNPAPGNTFGSIAGEWTANNFISNGSRNATSDVLVDGASATGYEQNSGAQIPLYRPSPDAVQEFKVEQNNFSAEIGYSGSTVVNMVTKSGTNAFRGSVYEYWRNNVLDANNWFNPTNSPLPGLHYNDFGVTVGGPIRKNKTFFFVDYEGNRIRSNSGTLAAGVPSADERTGNFEELCGESGGTFNSQGLCSVAAGQIWDPYSGYYDSNQGGAVRKVYIPFNNMKTYQSAGNKNLNGTGFQLPAQPGNLIDPVAAKMMSYFPLPNNFTSGPNGTYDPYNNWAGSGSNLNDHDQIDIRIDQQFNEKNTLSARFSWGRNPNETAQAFNSVMDPHSGGPQGFDPRMFALNDTHAFSAHTVLSLSYGFARVLHHVKGLQSQYPQFDPVTTLGLPAYIEDAGYKVAPAVLVGDNYNNVGYGLASIGDQPWSIQRYAQETHHLIGSVSHVRGRHELKFGTETRMHRVNSTQPGTPDGMFYYDHTGTEELPSGGSGDAMASFLTGVGGGGSWGQYEFPNAPATQNFQYAGYVLDNWKLTDTLTVNLGFRYELEIPRTERRNQMSWFDKNVVSPLPGSPIGTLHGGLVFASNSERHTADINYHGFAPRFGLAWRVRPTTVVRGGYGIFYQPSEYGAAGIGVVGYDGFDTLTGWLTTYQGDGATPWGRLSNPFPNGLLPNYGSSQGAATYLGTGVDGVIRNWNALPYTQTWSFGIQHQLPFQVLLDVNYVGTKGTHLYFNGAQNLDHLGGWVKSASQTEINNLISYVNNPFYGIITDPTVPLSAPQVQLYQLYLPYPQFTGVSGSFPPIAGSTYNALQIRVEKRMSKGLEFLASYVNSKSMDNSTVGTNITWLSGGYIPTGLIDPTNPSGERSISQADIPQVFNVAGVYELPLGKGKSWGGSWNSWINGFLGGWKISGTLRLDNGTPLNIGQQNGLILPGGYGHRPDLLAPLKRNHGSDWMNQYFANPQDAVDSADYTLGNAPRFLSSVRAPGTNTTTLAIAKEFGLGALREGSTLEFRAESFNALNHPQFCGPNTTIDVSNFGLVGYQCNSPREVQLGLRLTF